MALKLKMNALSVESINEVARQLESYRASLEHKARRVAQLLSERGVEIARLQIADLDAIFTGELISSVHNEYQGSFEGGAIFAVVADSKHAAFVEFGTGIVGKESPYPYPLPAGVQWQYASGKTIRQLSDGRYGWFYKGRDGNWYFTEGMKSRPFMYQTSMELQKIVVETVREVFKNG